MPLELLLDDPEERDFPAPERILAGLTPEQAVAVPTGLPYSVAKIVAHMTRIAREADLNRILFPAQGSAPAWTVGYKLAASVAKHNWVRTQLCSIT